MATKGKAAALKAHAGACVSSPATACLLLASARIKAAGSNKNARAVKSQRSAFVEASSQSTATKDTTPNNTPNAKSDGWIERSYHGAAWTLAVSGAIRCGAVGAAVTEA
jgi:hypothetical protein